jgi:hypothetical protein
MLRSYRRPAGNGKVSGGQQIVAVAGVVGAVDEVAQGGELGFYAVNQDELAGVQARVRPTTLGAVVSLIGHFVVAIAAGITHFLADLTKQS